MSDILGQIIRSLFGLAMVGGLLAFIYKRTAVDWERLAAAYGDSRSRDRGPPQDKRRFANMILYGRGRPTRSYKGVVAIALYDDGIGFRPNAFLVPFHKPIFVPYDDITGWRQNWYLDAQSVELNFRDTPDMGIIMPKGQVEWILSRDRSGISISEDLPPHGGPWRTRLLIILVSLHMLVGLAYAFRKEIFSFPLFQ